MCLRGKRDSSKGDAKGPGILLFCKKVGKKLLDGWGIGGLWWGRRLCHIVRLREGA